MFSLVSIKGAISFFWSRGGEEAMFVLQMHYELYRIAHNKEKDDSAALEACDSAWAYMNKIGLDNLNLECLDEAALLCFSGKLSGITLINLGTWCERAMEAASSALDKGSKSLKTARIYLSSAIDYFGSLFRLLPGVSLDRTEACAKILS
jgi:hypothetical protein